MNILRRFHVVLGVDLQTLHALLINIRELKHATFLSTRTVTGSDFAKKLTSHVTDVKSQISKLPIWRLW